MSNYTCAKLASRPDIYGQYACVTWVEQSPSLLDELAITKEAAAGLTVAIASLILMAYIGGLIGRIMLDV